jgi:ubiquitin conjugation factor E4 B
VSSASRQDTLRWMADTVRANEKRAGMQVDPNTVATDGFMTNILHVLLALCEPFMDINYTKVSCIV